MIQVYDMSTGELTPTEGPSHRQPAPVGPAVRNDLELRLEPVRPLHGSRPERGLPECVVDLDLEALFKVS